jgi:hypothetical protein
MGSRGVVSVDLDCAAHVAALGVSLLEGILLYAGGNGALGNVQIAL